MKLGVVVFTFCLLCAVSCRAASRESAAADTRAAVLFARVLHSEEGAGLKPATVIYVIPDVRPDKRLPTDKLFLITRAGMFYSFWLIPTRADLSWQAKLVPLSDEAALHPYGTLGFLLMKRGKGVPNSVSGGKHALGGAFLLDTDNRQPIMIYHPAKGKLVRDGELYF